MGEEEVVEEGGLRAVVRHEPLAPHTDVDAEDLEAEAVEDALEEHRVLLRRLRDRDEDVRGRGLALAAVRLTLLLLLLLITLIPWPHLLEVLKDVRLRMTDPADHHLAVSEVLRGHAVGNVELALFRAPQRCHVRLAPKLPRQILHQAADVGAGAAVDSEVEVRERLLERLGELDVVDHHWTLFVRHLNALACKLVGSLAVLLDR
mmetsp:Transcript_19264/g.44787  ORF Transcript_19264/g.44787 Transcript_19264/m.44787 type:complete len:205 (-) Transcript_19264:885-1499(-)